MQATKQLKYLNTSNVIVQQPLEEKLYTSYLEFKYIQCYCSTLLRLVHLASLQNLNTSNVIVQLPCPSLS